MGSDQRKWLIVRWFNDKSAPCSALEQDFHIEFYRVRHAIFFQHNPGTIKGIRALPVRGIVVFPGDGVSSNTRVCLLSTGVAVEFEVMKTWRDSYFAGSRL
jgi:hypothetical protein